MKNRSIYPKIVMVVVGIVLLSIFNPVHSVQAVPPAQDTAEPTVAATEAATATTAPIGQTPPAPNLSGDYVLKPAKGFAWMRQNPSSTAYTNGTIFPGQVVTAANLTGTGAPSEAWDGVQWWGFFLLAHSNFGGWIELASMQPFSVTATPGTPANQQEADWTVGTSLKLKAGVPFVWVRSAPLSTAAVLDTLLPSDAVAVTGSANSDGVQWWWQVQGPHGVGGWAEQQSLLPAASNVTPTATATGAASWVVGTYVLIRYSAPFSWLRIAGSSTAVPVYTVQPGTTLVIIGGAHFDGTQWWWPVRLPNGSAQGWVEQTSLI
ncbi:MAG TPA: SH3 domain-containing protein [Aggregatilineales bacterium]|nr:SH3 domain-containing protein [Aggregatilineales bacterium]